MKKIVSLLLVISLACVILPAVAEDDQTEGAEAETISFAEANLEAAETDFDGAWKLTDFLIEGYAMDPAIFGWDGETASIADGAITLRTGDGKGTQTFGKLEKSFEGGVLTNLYTDSETFTTTLTATLLVDGTMTIHYLTTTMDFNGFNLHFERDTAAK